MAIGTVSFVGTLANGATASIGPTSANGEWIIHNIYITDGATCDIKYSNASYDVDIDTVEESMLSLYSHVTYTEYLKVVNQSGGTIYYGYDGVSIV